MAIGAKAPRIAMCAALDTTAREGVDRFTHLRFVLAPLPDPSSARCGSASNPVTTLKLDATLAKPLCGLV